MEINHVPNVTPTHAAGLQGYPPKKGLQGIAEAKARDKLKLGAKKKGGKVNSAELLAQGMKRKDADELVTQRLEKKMQQ